MLKSKTACSDPAEKLADELLDKFFMTHKLAAGIVDKRRAVLAAIRRHYPKRYSSVPEMVKATDDPKFAAVMKKKLSANKLPKRKTRNFGDMIRAKLAADPKLAKAVAREERKPPKRRKQ